MITRPGRSHYAMVQEIKPRSMSAGESLVFARLGIAPVPRWACLDWDALRWACRQWSVRSPDTASNVPVLPRGCVRTWRSRKSRTTVAGRARGERAAVGRGDRRGVLTGTGRRARKAAAEAEEGNRSFFFWRWRRHRWRHRRLLRTVSSGLTQSGRSSRNCKSQISSNCLVGVHIVYLRRPPSRPPIALITSPPLFRRPFLPLTTMSPSPHSPKNVSLPSINELFPGAHPSPLLLAVRLTDRSEHLLAKPPSPVQRYSSSSSRTSPTMRYAPELNFSYPVRHVALCTHA